MPEEATGPAPGDLPTDKTPEAVEEAEEAEDRTPEPETAEPEAAAGDPQTPGPEAPSVARAVPPTCPTRTRLYRAGELLAEGFPAEEISERLDADAEAVVWLDLFDPDQSDLQIVVDEFGLHPLAVEDAIQSHERPKLDRYRSHLFANIYAVGLDEVTGEVTTGEIGFFVTDRALITVRKDDFDIDALIARWDLNAELVQAKNEVSVLVYGLLDAVVDGQYRVVEELEDAADELQTHLFQPKPDLGVRRRGYELGVKLANLRRLVAPMQDVVGRLARGDSHLAQDVLAPYYQDVHDHVLRAAEAIDATRDRVNRIQEVSLNEQGAQLNEITKKLAAWAAIIAVPTAVTGFYGQNVPYPGYEHHSGFLVSCLVILTLGGGLFFLLRRNGWL